MIHQCIRCEATTLQPRGPSSCPRCPHCGAPAPEKYIPPLDSTTRLRVANDNLAVSLKRPGA